PGDVLREDISFAGSRIKRPLQRDIEALFLRPRPVPGEIEAFLDEGIDIDNPVLAGTFARVQQHIPDDRIRTLAVLDDLVKIAPQRLHQLGNLATPLCVEGYVPKGFLQLADQLGRDPREIVDEIERVLDFVGDTRGELTERGQLLCLYQAVLSGAQILQR